MDCTAKCRSKAHGLLLQQAVSKGSPDEIRSYCRYLCHNFSTVTDPYGRTLLHGAASSGSPETVRWLLECCQAEVDTRDGESGWTPLHRALFYGQLACAAQLLQHGANPRIHDNEGYLPVDIVIKDRLPYITYSITDPMEVYVWGSNSNYSLGLGKQGSISHPELLKSFPSETSIVQVSMSKFHTIFLAADGKAYSCGHGQGGRLGVGSEQTLLSPSLVKIPTRISSVAAARDHTLFLDADSMVWSCGMNQYHQLGHLQSHNPPPEKLLSPKLLSKLSQIDGPKLTGVAAGTFHSVAFNETSLYTWGLNAGQLGHQKGEKTIVAPRLVSSLKFQTKQLIQVAASDGATVCATSSGDIFVLHEYQCRKIASQISHIKKICVVGGHLDTKLGVEELSKEGGPELKIVVLTTFGKVYIWRESIPALRRCLINSGHQIHVQDIHLNLSSFVLATEDGLGFVGTLMAPKSTAMPKRLSSAFKQQGLISLLDREECDVIKVKPISGAFRALLVTSDPRGNNFTLLQAHPKLCLTDIPQLSLSTLDADLKNLLHSSSPDDNISDIILKVEGQSFPLHKCVLAAQWDHFRKLLAADPDLDEYTLKDMSLEVFKLVLSLIYSSRNFSLVTTLLSSGASSESGMAIPTQIKGQDVKKLKKLGLPSCISSLPDKAGFTRLLEKEWHTPLVIARKELSHLADTWLLCEDQVKLPCHKAILVSRMDYFKAMFLNPWLEKTSQEAIPMPFTSKIMEVVLDYVYTDHSKILETSSDVEFVCHALKAADQLLLPRLKELCEIALVRFLTLKNTGEILELAMFYRAIQLQDSCFNFICVNLPSFLENGTLELLSSETLDALTTFYRERHCVMAMARRRITPSPEGPSTQDLREIMEVHPVDSFTAVEVNPATRGKKTRSRRDRQTSVSEVAKSPEVPTTPSSTPPPLSTPAPPSPPKDNKPPTLKQSTNMPQKGHLSSHLSPELLVESTKIKSDWEMSTQDFPLLKDAAPAEKSTLNNNLPISKNLPHSSDKKKKTKLSQKQKKELLKTPPKPVTPEIEIPRSILSCPWAIVNDRQKSPSFLEASPPLNVSPGRLDGAAVSPPSPWNCASSPPFNFSTSPLGLASSPDSMFAAIQRDQLEEERAFSLSKVAKPLHLISMEEEAMEELRKLYQQVYLDEEIVVERVLPKHVHNPVWKARKSRNLF